jgi:hypothetical protein
MIVALSENGARDALGGLDVVVANAGVPTRFQPVHEVEVGYSFRGHLTSTVTIFSVPVNLNGGL